MIATEQTRSKQSAQLLLDPLQRRAELVWHYDFHGYPERARYLERAEEGPALLERLQEQDPDALRDLIGWWTGRPGIEAVRLEHSILALAGRRDAAALSARLRLEDALSAGLAARVNTYMAPLGLPTADTTAYTFLLAWRELACGSRLAAQAPLPAVELPGGMTAHLVYCERCSVVDLHRRPARRCRRCADRHERPPGTLRMPKSHPHLPWLVVGDSTVHICTCEVCGSTFLSTRSHATKCPGSRCRTAKARRRQSRAERAA